MRVLTHIWPYPQSPAKPKTLATWDDDVSHHGVPIMMGQPGLTDDVCRVAVACLLKHDAFCKFVARALTSLNSPPRYTSSRPTGDCQGRSFQHLTRHFSLPFQRHQLPGSSPTGSYPENMVCSARTTPDHSGDSHMPCWQIATLG